jgi:hypothetical protein
MADGGTGRIQSPERTVILRLVLDSCSVLSVISYADNKRIGIEPGRLAKRRAACFNFNRDYGAINCLMHHRRFCKSISSGR